MAILTEEAKQGAKDIGRGTARIAKSGVKSVAKHKKGAAIFAGGYALGSASNKGRAVNKHPYAGDLSYGQ